jgi:hypothetical protein
VPVLWTGTRWRGFHVETARVVVMGVVRMDRRGRRARRAWDRILGGGMGVGEEGDLGEVVVWVVMDGDWEILEVRGRLDRLTLQCIIVGVGGKALGWLSPIK